MTNIEDLSLMAPELARLEFEHLLDEQSAREKWLHDRTWKPIEVLAKEEGIKMADDFLASAIDPTRRPFAGYFMLEDPFHRLAHTTFRNELNLDPATTALGTDPTIQIVVNNTALRGYAELTADRLAVVAAHYESLTAEQAVGHTATASLID